MRSKNIARELFVQRWAARGVTHGYFACTRLPSVIIVCAQHLFPCTVPTIWDSKGAYMFLYCTSRHWEHTSSCLYIFAPVVHDVMGTRKHTCFCTVHRDIWSIYLSVYYIHSRCGGSRRAGLRRQLPPTLQERDFIRHVVVALMISPSARAQSFGQVTSAWLIKSHQLERLTA